MPTCTLLSLYSPANKELWPTILRSGARWQDLPEKYPHPSTCWRRLRDGEEQGVWLKIWRTFLSELNERQQLQWSESLAARGNDARGHPRRPRPSCRATTTETPAGDDRSLKIYGAFFHIACFMIVLRRVVQ